jgi:hypothetical protein
MLIKNKRAVLDDSNKNILLQTSVFIFIAITYIVQISLLIKLADVHVREFFENDIAATIDIISISTYLISAFILNEYRKEKNQKFLLYSYLIVFSSQIIQLNLLMSALMGIYVLRFRSFLITKDKLTSLEEGKGKSVFSLSLLNLSVSVLIAYIKFIVS